MRIFLFFVALSTKHFANSVLKWCYVSKVFIVIIIIAINPGKMYLLNLLHPKPTPVQLQIKGELDLSSFNPHGISVYTDETDDNIYVFVVNHPDDASQVEIFRFVAEDTLEHLKTITHPLLHRYVLYIYVSDISDHEIDVFERKKGEKLEFIKSVDVGSSCDNIEVDQKTGDLWMGCHPNLMKMVTYDPKDPPGSEVLKIKNIHSENPVVSLEYGDDGKVLMVSTVATPYKGKLLIGSVFHKALYCDLK
uniref:Serum paraoxonase/arylesterase 2-like n=1 Tax=Acanthochromis polyacanthus TaxID=80966 RepID=A0A3Q1FMC2_9TELE